ncbi:Uncharacterised protein [Serratia proteamaculans]|uniref:toll/interleukin-1 receptor domain-containing protein n=1 Tax=Serratia proteamaculans TaxID=28151 RepID=UPI00218302E1|nr:toll/interleukin-1 receptor domain-containing protein [Serratia proteamaculans]CAI2400618.1 Uncharacterised protein [Serratia proteamaculans]
MSKSVFISHATKDIDLVRAFVDLIETGIGVPDDEIFCSSLDEYGIPVGENFVSYMKNQMVEPKVVIMLMTPSYFDSNFCLCEMGAAWVKSHKMIPIIVPPSDFSDVKDVLLGIQVIKIDDKLKINSLRDDLISAVNFQPKSGTKWDIGRDVFFGKLQSILDKLSRPDMVSREEYNRLQESNNGMVEIIAENDKKIRELRSYINELKNLKDEDEVKALVNKYESDNDVDDFYDLLCEINKIRSCFPSRTIFKYVMCDYYGKPFGEIDDADKMYFDDAIRRNYLNNDNGIEVNESNKNVSLLIEKLIKLRHYNQSDSVIAQFNDCQTVAFEFDNQDFWDEFYMS